MIRASPTTSATPMKMTIGRYELSNAFMLQLSVSGYPPEAIAAGPITEARQFTAEPSHRPYAATRRGLAQAVARSKSNLGRMMALARISYKTGIFDFLRFLLHFYS
jgi:hypothetical protein